VTELGMQMDLIEHRQKHDFSIFQSREPLSNVNESSLMFDSHIEFRVSTAAGMRIALNDDESKHESSIRGNLDSKMTVSIVQFQNHDFRTF
jgi:hypothetical protein